MKDNHSHCVYYQRTAEFSTGGQCLLHNKEIKHFLEAGCENIVLKPSVILALYIKDTEPCRDGDEAYKKAVNYLKEHKRNS